MRRCSVGLQACAFLLFATVLAQTPPSGQELFTKRCGGCHDLDRDKEGPHLRGVHGRTAAAVPGFPYSDTLKKSSIRWNDETLDRWLAGPDKLAPGTDMEFHVEKEEERKIIIAYLKQQ
jgi:cytochrome c